MVGPGGQGRDCAGDGCRRGRGAGPTGLGTGCACLSAARLPHRLVGGGAERRGGETPPSCRPREGRGPLFLPPPAPGSPPLAPRAPAPRAPAACTLGMLNGGPAKEGFTGCRRMGWGPLGQQGRGGVLPPPLVSLLTDPERAETLN